MILDRKQKIIIALAVIVLGAIIVMLTGCAQNMNLAPQAQYYSTLKTFNDNIETYLASYQSAVPEVQAKWKATIDPLILTANQALQAWRLSYGSATESQKEQIWLDEQKKFMKALVDLGILKVEGGK